jgi:hypothetical protein
MSVSDDVLVDVNVHAHPHVQTQKLTPTAPTARDTGPARWIKNFERDAAVGERSSRSGVDATDTPQLASPYYSYLPCRVKNYTYTKPWYGSEYDPVAAATPLFCPWAPYSAATKAGAAGVLIFVHVSQYTRFQPLLDILNNSGRVSAEVQALYCVKPTRDAVKSLCENLRADPALQHLEMIQKLKPNNGLRDLTAKWRIESKFADDFMLVVGLETVNDFYRKKYPHPNLTLHAGKIEEGETTLEAAKRELFEEARMQVTWIEPPIGLMGKGMVMYSVYIMPYTRLHLEDHVIYIQ